MRVLEGGEGAEEGAKEPLGIAVVARQWKRPPRSCCCEIGVRSHYSLYFF